VQALKTDNISMIVCASSSEECKPSISIWTRKFAMRVEPTQRKAAEKLQRSKGQAVDVEDADSAVELTMIARAYAILWAIIWTGIQAVMMFTLAISAWALYYSMVSSSIMARVVY
jgi:hypothetical protein